MRIWNVLVYRFNGTVEGVYPFSTEDKAQRYATACRDGYFKCEVISGLVDALDMK